MDPRPPSAVDAIVRHHAAGRFDIAASEAERALAQAARGAPDQIRPLARALAEHPRLMPIFHDNEDAHDALEFYERLDDALTTHLGDAAPELLKARERLALLYSLTSQPDRAARVYEQMVETLTRTVGPNDEATHAARSSLAIQYRNLGQDERASALLADTGICDDLRPVQDYLLAQGLHIASVGTPWSSNCRTWVYFRDVVLNADALRARFNLPDFVTIHSHLGTHDGSEHGLVCTRHHDALMAAHPEMADDDTPTVS